MDITWIRRLSEITSSSTGRYRRRAREFAASASPSTAEGSHALDHEHVVGPSSGDWGAATNWSLDHVPTLTEDVFIGEGNTVTFSAGTDTVQSLLTGGNATLILSGGTLNDPNTFDVPGQFQLTGGTLSEVTPDTTITAMSSGATLNGIIFKGSLRPPDERRQRELVGRADAERRRGVPGQRKRHHARPARPHRRRRDHRRHDREPGDHHPRCQRQQPYRELRQPHRPLQHGAHLTINGTAGLITTAGQPFDNRGTITADPGVLGTGPGTIKLSGTNWTNDGTLQALNGDNLFLTGTATASPATHAWTNDAGGTTTVNGGGTLTLGSDNGPVTPDNSAWLNLGTISSNASTVDLGGTFTFAALGTYNRTAGAVNLTGTLNNTGSTLLLNNTTGSWTLDSGTVQGGTVQATPGNAVVGSTGTLAAVTLDAGGGNASPLDMNTNTSLVYVSSGLTLGGVTIFLGNTSGTTTGRLAVRGGAETIDGTPGHPGIITLGDSSGNGLSNSGFTAL